ncbi:MAG: hypothetical protein QM530_00715 [Phycisphaerales bacterium]|nr:hypothetical protein [Phycisphaerales bacterium]
MNRNLYLLDLVDKFANAIGPAYSVRKLKRSYNASCMRVRRSGDNAEADVLFDDNVVTANSNVVISSSGTGGLAVGSTLTFSTFYSGRDVYVNTWYDQSGLRNNAVQTTTSAQPRIVNAGTLITENSIATIQFNGFHTLMFLGLTTAIRLTAASLFSVYRATTPGDNAAVAQGTTYSYNINTYYATGKLGVTRFGIADSASTISHNTTTLDLALWRVLQRREPYFEIDNSTTSASILPFPTAAALDTPIIAINQIYGNASASAILKISEIVVTQYASSAQRAIVFASQKTFFKTP